MAIPKTGSRKIMVDSVEYRWHIRRQPTPMQGGHGTCVTGAVELLENPGSVLWISFLWNHHRNYDGAEFAIVPNDVAAAITDALKAGWNPAILGGNFEFRQSSKVSFLL
ncbi:MAG: hypothetical protein F6J87_27965 [Spirulina sp. SIO3F2]|nr:hypothetical protein [Spirulina sp. SIO3F2]